MRRDDLLAAGHTPMSPLKALRLRCLDCCADQPSEVRQCAAVTCPAWPFRMGVNPWRKEPSEAQMEARRKAAARLPRRGGKSISVIDETAVLGVAGTDTPASTVDDENNVIRNGSTGRQSHEAVARR